VSVRHGLLALLQRGPMHGYQLHSAFSQIAGDLNPLNIGQVYSTLSRLERDGLVRSQPDEGSRPHLYGTTDAGTAELANWLTASVAPADRAHNEVVIKVVLALVTPGVNAKAVVEQQRTQTARTIQELTSRRAQAEPLPTQLTIDRLTFRLEAELRWLDSLDPQP
jgi:DNA-binding PadR family transcriptional regulator